MAWNSIYYREDERDQEFITDKPDTTIDDMRKFEKNILTHDGKTSNRKIFYEILGQMFTSFQKRILNFQDE